MCAGQEAEEGAAFKEIPEKLEPRKPCASLPRAWWYPGRVRALQAGVGSEWCDGHTFWMAQAAFQKRASHSSGCAELFAEGRVTMTDLVSNLFHLLGSVPMQSKREHDMSVRRSNSQTQVL